MTIQPFAHRRLFTKGRPVQDLVAILKNEDNVYQRGLYDLDGTLHRGLFPCFLKGITNADLALYLAARIPLSQFPPFLFEGMHIFLYERIHIREGKDEERSKHIPYLVDTFRNALTKLPEKILREAIGVLPHMQYAHAKNVLKTIHAEGTIISCGFHPVAFMYGNAFDISSVFANHLFPTDPRQHGDIYGAMDKWRIASTLDADRYVVIGDTADDIGMAVAAKSKNPESVVIALHGRCSHLAEEADIIAPSWQDLRELLSLY